MIWRGGFGRERERFRLRGECGHEERRRRGGGAENKFGRTFGDDLAAGGARLGTDFEDPVGGFQDVEIVFDDDETVAGVDESVKRSEETFDVVAVEAGGWFVEENERTGGRGGRSGWRVGGVGASS